MKQAATPSPQSAAYGAAVLRQLMTPADVALEYGIAQNTQAVWRSTKRYGFHDLVIKVGSRVRYRRGDIERWLESRRQSD
jgi:hypothetical protein